MTSSRRIVFNAGISYARSIVAAGLALFSSRWVLNALGPIDFGLFSIVGSIIIFITFLNSVLAASAGRHYAYAIGQGNPEEVNRWFNAALSIHVFLAVSLTLIGWPIGEYVVTHILTIPADRVTTCRWVFRISLISAFFNMISIPFIAMFIATQRIVELSLWSMSYAVLAFVLGLFLFYAPGDRLLFYAAGMVLILTIIMLAQIVSAIAKFRECQIIFQHWFDKYRIKEIYSFASWNLIGSFGSIIRDQGSALLLNLQFGPKINAAYGVANQVSNQTNQLATAMLGALSPEITTSEGRGERNRMLDLAQRSSKFATIFVMLFAVPLIAEMDYVLVLWLREPPTHTANFCQLILAMCILDRLSAGHALALNAHGQIAAYQATLGAIHVLTLPIAWVFFMIGFPPTSVGIAFIITMGSVALGRVLWLRQLLRVPVSSWINAVVIPSGIVALASVSAVMIPRLLLSSSLLRFSAVILISTIAILLTAWFFTLDGNERRFFKHNTRHLLIKMGIDCTSM